jgi:hypothetical protein
VLVTSGGTTVPLGTFTCVMSYKHVMRTSVTDGLIGCAEKNTGRFIDNFSAGTRGAVSASLLTWVAAQGQGQG